jgi:hypothetical protein
VGGLSFAGGFTSWGAQSLCDWVARLRRRLVGVCYMIDFIKFDSFWF